MDGKTKEKAFLNIGTAITDIAAAIGSSSRTGLILVDAGDYPSINVSGIKPASWISIRGFASQSAPVTVQQNSTWYHRGRGIKLVDCKNIHFTDIDVAGFQEGCLIEKSNHINFKYCHVYDMGQNGFCICKNSYTCLVDHCLIQFTGQKQGKSKFGEGVYIGTGGTSGSSSSIVDNTHSITIQSTRIFNTTAEAVDIKPGCYGNKVRYCTIRDIENQSGGAISVKFEKGRSSPYHVPNRIYGNTITNVTATQHTTDNGTLLFRSDGTPLISRDGIGIRADSNTIILNNTIKNAGDMGIMMRPHAKYTNNSESTIVKKYVIEAGNNKIASSSSNYIADIKIIDTYMFGSNHDGSAYHYRNVKEYDHSQSALVNYNGENY